MFLALIKYFPLYVKHKHLVNSPVKNECNNYFVSKCQNLIVNSSLDVANIFYFGEDAIVLTFELSSLKIELV